MRSTDAARLLAAARSADALPALVAALGFADPFVPLAATHLAGCGVRRPRLTAGPGLLRAIVGEVDGDGSAREAVASVARRLARAAPATLWLIALTGRGGSEVAIAVWRADAAGPRVAALVADPARLLPSDAETVCAMAAAAVDAAHAPGGDVLAHARWLTLLGREALSRRFYRHLESAVRRLAASARAVPARTDRDTLALLYTSRLLFLAFLESKGWLDGDHAFLRRGFDACMAAGGGYHERVLRPLFFGTLNAPWSRRASTARAFGRVPFLNGGLFSPTPLERRHRALQFGDAELGVVLVELLGGYRFTARESHDAFSEVAIDPEMLGRAFESLMGTTDRRTTGAFYTPQRLVAHATHEALRAALLASPLGTEPVALSDVDALLDGATPDPTSASTVRLRQRLATLRVLDPACGSGAFLVHALERVAALRVRCGDARPLAAVRRDVLTESIFGVDLNPTAVWLCELRLWLSVVVEREETDPLRVAPLPNLDHHVRVGDALATGPLERGNDPWTGADARRPTTLGTLRRRYAATSGARKTAATVALERAERAAAIAALDRALVVRRAERAELLTAARGRDLFGGRRGSEAAERRRLTELRSICRTLASRRRALRDGGALPFGFASHFADIGAHGGFDIALGNPPWVRPHALAASDRLALHRAYETCRDAAWTPGAIAARAGRGFGGQADLAAPFLERSIALLRPGGVLALLVPAKLWRSLAGGGVRRVLARDTHVRRLDDWSDAPSLFDAAVYPSLIVAERRIGPNDDRAASITVRVHRAGAPRTWSISSEALAFDATPGSPWLLVPPDVRHALGLLRAAGNPLGTAGVGRLLLGVKCGRNAAFVVHVTGDDGALAEVSGVGPDGTRRHGTVERAMLRRVVRGETLHASDVAEHVIWPYDEDGTLLGTLPPHAARWLAPWRSHLSTRADARDARRWWALFRTAAASDDAPRIVWADVARTLRPRILAAGDRTVPLNSCYALRCDGPCADVNARALAALLSSRVADAWLAALAEPARGGYRRHLAWTVALLPVPRDWARARTPLGGCGPLDVDAAVADAYGLPPDALRSLLAWADGRELRLQRGAP